MLPGMEITLHASWDKGLSRNQNIEGGREVVLIYVRINIDHNQTVAEGDLR